MLKKTQASADKKAKGKARRANALPKPPSPERIATVSIELAERYLGDRQRGLRIADLLCIARDMHIGARAYHRPAVRRDKLASIGKTMRKLAHHLDGLDAQTVADAMGRVVPAEWMSKEEAAGNDLPADVRVTKPVFSLAPALLTRYGEMRTTMALLEGGVLHLARKQPATRSGAGETPDALMFALEGLAALWLTAKGEAPVILGRKRGSFGAFAQQALSLNADVFKAAQVKTGLRRLHEKAAVPR